MKYILLTVAILFVWTSTSAQQVEDIGPTTGCVKMQLAISSTLLKMANNENYYTFSYCNHGSGVAINTTVELELDAELTIISSERAIIAQNNNTYTLALGDIQGGICGSFRMQVAVNASATANQVHCTSARILYDSPTCNDGDILGSTSNLAQSMSLGISAPGNGVPIGPVINMVFEDNVMLNQNPLSLDTLLIIAAEMSMDVGTVITTIEDEQKNQAIDAVSNYSSEPMVDAAHCVFNIGSYQTAQSNNIISSTDDVAESEISIKIYPNPMTTDATVEITQFNNTAGVVFELVDLTGRTVKQLSTKDTTIRLEHKGLTAGVYFYRLRDTNEILAQGKLVIR